MQKLLPRSPYERLGGYVHLPRLIDKARLHRKGLLAGYNYKTVGFDKHLLAFLKIDPDAFEKTANELEDDADILAWIRQNGLPHAPEEIERWNEAMIHVVRTQRKKERVSSISSRNRAVRGGRTFAPISI